MRKKLKKITIISFIVMLIMNLFNMQSYAKLQVGNKTRIYGEKECASVLQIKSNNALKFITKVYYKDPDTNKKLYAFCVEPTKDGVGSGATDFSGYDVTITEQLKDQKIWRALVHGYMGIDWEDTTVECDDDWYAVTKAVIHCIVNNKKPSDAYEIPTKVALTDTATLEELQRRSKKVIKEADKLYDYAINGTYTYTKPLISIQKVDGFKSEGDNMVQTLKVTANAELGTYSVSLSNFPLGTTYTKSGNTIKVIIPKQNIKQDVNGTVNVLNAEVKSYPAFYANAVKEEWQDYIATGYPYEEVSSKINLNLEADKSIIKIIKKDKETQEVIPNTVFQIEKNGQVLKTVTTDEKGEAIIERIYPNTYTITEIEANENYVLNDNSQEITIKYNESKIVEFYNLHKKGNLKIIKVDKDDNTLTLEGIEFDLIYPDGTTYHLKTDANGVIELNNINTGNLTLIEKKTKQEYKLNGEQQVQIEWNKTTDLIIENEKYKSKVEIYKTDAEDNEWKLKGIEFDVFDEDMKYIETITTDDNGYAITSEIATGGKTGILYIQEKKTDEFHILNDELIEVNIEADSVSTLKLTNERIKGQIKVIKTSKDDNFINGLKAGSPIENVKFEIYDSDNNIVGEITTDKDGIATTKLLDKGCYYIKEIYSGEWYLLNENMFTAETKIHEEIVEVNITNESEKPDVDIEKTGIIQTTANQEIRYDFKIKNTGNVPLNDFTWYDYLPSEYVKITKLITGTYNQDLNYSIYYKTNLNNYRLLVEDLNTQVNNYIDFSNIKLEKGEVITEFKADFGTVNIGFESVINPYIFVKVNSAVKNDDVFTNETRIEGYHKTYMVWDEDNHTTKVYEKKIEIKKLPRTGM